LKRGSKNECGGAWETENQLFVALHRHMHSYDVCTGGFIWRKHAKGPGHNLSYGCKKKSFIIFLQLLCY